MRPERFLLCLFGILFLISSEVSYSGTVADISLQTSNADKVLTISGSIPLGMIGLQVRTGDFNGDGIDDLLIATRDNPTSGYSESVNRIFVLFGSEELKGVSNLDLMNSDNVLTIYGKDASEYIGGHIAVGDINGDGIDDVIAGAWHASPQDTTSIRNKAGKIYVIFGGEDLSTINEIQLNSTTRPYLEIHGEYPYGQLGWSIAAGDFNGDGFDDILAGAYNASSVNGTKSGISYVIFGAEEMSGGGIIDLVDPENTNVLSIYGARPNDRLGWGTASGDINKDGFDEIIIGAYTASPYNRNGAGEVYVIPGSADLHLTSIIDLQTRPEGVVYIPGLNGGDYMGNHVIAGDLNGNGYDDLCLNAHGVDALGRSNCGAIYVIFGSDTVLNQSEILVNGNNILRIYGEKHEDLLGPMSIGDVNGDGYGDLITGAINGGPSSEGRGYIIFGSSDFGSKADIDLLQPSTDIVKVTGKSFGDCVGVRNTVGDFNNDGYADAVFSGHAVNSNFIPKSGEVYIVWGETWEKQFSNFEFTSNTGNNSVIMIPSDIIIEGFTLANGDEIGVFTPDGLCCGAGIWTGQNLPITVWGDNPVQEGINGFLTGESYKFVIFKSSTGKFIDVSVEFSSGPSVFQVDGISVASSISIPSNNFIVPLSQGWNTISSPIMPEIPQISSVFDDLGQSLKLMKDGKGNIYWPEYSVDQLLDWDISKGYQVFMNNEAELLITGEEHSSVVYELSTMWNLISYTGIDGASPATAFGQISDKLILVQNGAGDVFWPEYNIEGITAMRHGEGYWVCVTDGISFGYPQAVPKIANSSSNNLVPTYFVPVAVTGNNSVILITGDIVPNVNGIPLTTDDEIGVFDSQGICVGAVVWESGGNKAITVWGNDSATNSDGIEPGDQYNFKVWISAESKEYDCAVTYVSGSDSYVPHDIVVLGSLDADSPTNVDQLPGSYELLPNTPNPFNPSTTISFTLPEEIKVTLTIYSITGERVAVIADGVYGPGIHTLTWDAGKYANGVYICRMVAGGYTQTRRMLLLK